MLKCYLDGGKDITAKYEQIMATLKRNLPFNNDDLYDICERKRWESRLSCVLPYTIEDAKDSTSKLPTVFHCYSVVNITEMVENGNNGVRHKLESKF